MYRTVYTVKEEDIANWIDEKIREGMDVYDMVIGLYVEKEIETTYSILRRKISRTGIRIPRYRQHKFYWMEETDRAGILKNSRKLPGKTLFAEQDFPEMWEEIKEELGCKKPELLSRTGESHIEQEIKALKTLVEGLYERLDGVSPYIKPPKEFILEVSVEEMKVDERTLVINDMHIPYHDTKVLGSVVNLAKEEQFDSIILNGDVIDNEGLSLKFKRNKYGLLTPAQQIELAAKFLSHLRSLCPNSRIIYIYGNHEYRYEDYIRTHAPEIIDLPGISLKEKMKCSDQNIEVVDVGLREAYITWGNIRVGHWDVVRQSSGYTATGLIRAMGISLVHGHSHRSAFIRKRLSNDTIFGIENGCLCQLDPIYKLETDWHHAFTVLNRYGNRIHPEFVPVEEDGSFMYQGKHYAQRKP